MKPQPDTPRDEELPPKPERPDCCGGGCAICVLDTYQDELASWQAQVDEILRRRGKGDAAQGLARMSEAALPPRPQPPEGYDCCGGGCADCELRLYLRRLAQWQKECEEIQTR